MSMQVRREILKRAERGETYASIGKALGISRQRVHQILKEMDPDWTSRRPIKPKKESAKCPVCGQDPGPRRKKFCSDEHFEAMQALKQLTEYYEARRQKLARYYLRHTGNVHPSAVRWAKKVLSGAPATRRHILRDSEIYQKLEEAGLVDQLPDDIRVLG